MDEAKYFIEKVTIKPNAFLCGDLFGACRIHSNIELGELEVVFLSEEDIKDPRKYVFLSNIYSLEGRWHAKQKLREKMNEKIIKKTSRQK